ncbi:hypothetical protein VIN01S_21520 [Vibrio inusitatus NBRC 102082]|uniref:Uncharacterized protein n=1 Tax=Vibrio inusitatus NBRC 102082 TaxID=1219070 RepID=A0A4Y3HWF6_9VIBR|nr:hypothetical protein VIN01S_21520 [Vibrio inusitatus NBRC 102082]
MFYDWHRLFQLPAKWVSTFGVTVALIMAGIFWSVWGQHNKSIRVQLLDELALQQQSHLLYLRKLKQLDEQTMDYRNQYLKRANFASNEVSKTVVFNYLSLGLENSSVNVILWQWEQGLYSRHLVLELKGTYSDIAQFLRKSVRLSEVITVKELLLSRQSIDKTQINARIVLAFFSAESAESH